jgi:hypothetical protein
VKTLDVFLSLPDMRPWRLWWERVQTGRVTSEEVEWLYVHPDTQKMWEDKKNGFARVTAWIDERLREVEGPEARELEAAKQTIESGSGATVVIEDGAAKVVAVVSQADLDVQNDPRAQQLHGELLQTLSELVRQTARMGNSPNWMGIDRSARDYEAIARDGLAGIAENVSRFWTLSSRLGGYINQDDDIRSGKTSMAEPLEPDVRRAILEALVPGAPLVRCFPTGLANEADFIAWNQPRERTGIVIKMVQTATQQQVLQTPSADLLTENLISGDRAGVQATKNRSWAFRLFAAFLVTATIMVTPVGKFAGGVATKAGEKFAENSKTVRKFTDYLIDQEKLISEYLNDLPPEIGALIREVIRRLREGPPRPPVPPSGTTMV